jgi:hypothetical protein
MFDRTRKKATAGAAIRVTTVVTNAACFLDGSLASAARSASLSFIP